MCKQCPDGRFSDFPVLVGKFPNPFDHTSVATRSGELLKIQLSGEVRMVRR